MAAPEDKAETIDRAPPRPAYLYSVIALAFGIVLGVAASAVFGMLGWGGEVASQTAGAVSGAAPLILDGLRRHRAERSRSSLPPLTRGTGYRPKLFLASVLGFSVLIIDSVASLLLFPVTRWAIKLAAGDQAQLMVVYGLLGTVVVLPLLLACTYLLAVASGHRMGDRQRRWILLGIGIYAAMRIATVMASSPSPELNVSPGLIVVGVISTLPLLVGSALLGARRARKTQAAYYAKAYFRRLAPADQEAALDLLDETVTAPRS